MKKEIIIMSVFLTNLAAYNNGQLQGEWVNLPASSETISAAMERVLGNDEEYFITDYESEYGLSCGEYDSIFKLNEEAESLAEFSDDEIELITELENLGYSHDEAVEIVTDGDYVLYADCHDMTDVAYEVVESCGYLEQIPENLRYYFDYAAFGRDLNIEGHFIAINGSIVEIIR